LQRFTSVQIDNSRHVLALGESPSSAATAPVPTAPAPNTGGDSAPENGPSTTIASETTTAHTTDWVIYVAGKDKCANARDFSRSSPLATPGGLAEYLRSIGKTPSINVTRDSNGAPTMVTIAADGTAYTYFASADTCDLFKTEVEKNGNADTPDLH
jgi:hypothetical protein